jgi:hypothetical protein
MYILLYFCLKPFASLRRHSEQHLRDVLAFLSRNDLFRRNADDEDVLD